MNSLSLAGIDVGAPQLKGTTVYSAGGVAVVAGGEDIWGTRDQFHFAHARISGDFSLTLRLDSLTMADVYTKAGIMLRASLDEAAEHAYLLAFGDNQPRNKNNGGLEFQFREKIKGPSIGVYPPQPLPARPDFPVNFPNVWLRLIRQGDKITAQHSQEGTSWKNFCVHHQRFSPTAYLGLAVTSHHSAQTVQAVFSQLAFTQ